MDKLLQLVYSSCTDKKYYTIVEFSEKVGVSLQTIYRKLAPSLLPFVKIENGPKHIFEKALLEFGTVTCENNCEKLARQLREKEVQIQQKDEQITLLRNQVAELAQALVELTI